MELQIQLYPQFRQGFDIILDVISFLTCTNDEECEAYYVQEWNILTGGNQNSFPVNDLINGVKNVSNNVSNVTYNFQNLGSGFENIISTFGNTLQSQLNNVFDISTCNIGPILCGPPSISIFGGTGLDLQLTLYLMLMVQSLLLMLSLWVGVIQKVVQSPCKGC